MKKHKAPVPKHSPTSVLPPRTSPMPEEQKPEEAPKQEKKQVKPKQHVPELPQAQKGVGTPPAKALASSRKNTL